MTNKESNTRAVTNISINSKRFLESLMSSIEVYEFCMGLSKNKRVSGQIIKRLLSLGINE